MRLSLPPLREPVSIFLIMAVAASPADAPGGGTARILHELTGATRS